MSKQTKTRRVHVPTYDYDMPLKTYQLQCAWCGQDALVTCYPGRPPRFCSTDCATEARKAHDRARKATGQPQGHRQPRQTATGDVAARKNTRV
ncbi:MAG: hypothetical protein H0T53_16275 [Herpetosiphonaceae bacterium]|nr:hypothetical protein [Herpetosiphonaceae bacterium]